MPAEPRLEPADFDPGYRITPPPADASWAAAEERLGVPPLNPSWGADISAAREAFPVNAWAALFPELAITLTVLGFNLLGDAPRDALDPRLRA